MGAGLSIVLLDPGFIGPEWGWRIAFGLGGVLAVRHPAGAAPRAGKPALAADARPLRGGRSGGRAQIEAKSASPSTGRIAPRDAGAAHDVVARGDPRAAGALPQARRLRPHPDGLAGVLLQRDLLHLRAGAHALLRRARRPRRLLHLPVRGRQLPRPAGARAPVRHGRPPLHDRRHLRHLRRRPARHRLRLPAGLARPRPPRRSPGRRSSSSPRPPRARPTSR